MVVNAIQTISTWVTSMALGSDVMPMLLSKLPVNWITLAQQITDPDIMGQMQRAWATFVQSGQIWAFLIGLILGYMVRTFTSFG